MSKRSGDPIYDGASRADAAFVGGVTRQIVGGPVIEDLFDPGWGVELGYSCHPAAWGQGYATELVRACLAWADRKLGTPEVRAFVHPNNTVSRRVLDRTNFAKVRLLLE